MKQTVLASAALTFGEISIFAIQPTFKINTIYIIKEMKISKISRLHHETNTGNFYKLRFLQCKSKLPRKIQRSY